MLGSRRGSASSPGQAMGERGPALGPTLVAGGGSSHKRGSQAESPPSASLSCRCVWSEVVRDMEPGLFRQSSARTAGHARITRPRFADQPTGEPSNVVPGAWSPRKDDKTGSVFGPFSLNTAFVAASGLRGSGAASRETHGTRACGGACAPARAVTHAVRRRVGIPPARPDLASGQRQRRGCAPERGYGPRARARAKLAEHRPEPNMRARASGSPEATQEITALAALRPAAVVRSRRSL